ncbi:hypothetical protein QFZ73_004862 [Peribacillus sp. V2I11]|nr:hypothetical protein [Peribacillus sp. V2I11]
MINTKLTNERKDMKIRTFGKQENGSLQCK